MNEDKIYFVVFHLLQRAYLIFTTLYLRYSAVKRVDNIDFLVVHFHWSSIWNNHLNNVAKIFVEIHLRNI